jgi:CpeS-like protein
MLDIQDFFSACVGTWKTERTYHYPLHNEVERSYTEFNVGTLASAEKSQISSAFLPLGSSSDRSEIVTYQRPQPGEVPTVINLVGFGLEQKTAAISNPN